MELPAASPAAAADSAVPALDCCLVEEGREEDKQTDRQTDRQTDKQTDKQTEAVNLIIPHVHVYTCINTGEPYAVKVSPP